MQGGRASTRSSATKPTSRPAAGTEREGRPRGEAGYHLTLLAKNATGFKNLDQDGVDRVPRRLSTTCRASTRKLLEAHSEGIICLCGCLAGEFSELILKDQIDEGRGTGRVVRRGLRQELLHRDSEQRPRHSGPVHAGGGIDIAKRLGLPLVATCDAHYLCQDDADRPRRAPLHQHRQDAQRRASATTAKAAIQPFYVRSPEEMYRLFPGHADAVQRSQEIADGVDIQLDFKKRHFPVFTPPASKTPEEYLRELCEQGLQERYGDEPAAGSVRARLEHELDIICRMGFASYFLIVWDFVRFAREKRHPVRRARLGCGALVSYVLELSHVDPLEYDLLFERFLDPNRSEAPDIDIDFCQDRREEVIDYVKQKYGEQSVAQIATFGTLAAKAAIKDVGRVLDIPLDRVNQLTKMVRRKPGHHARRGAAQSPDLRREYETDPQVRELIDIARKLEGTNRNAGTHAAGVVIANGPITDYVPVQRVVRKDESGDGDTASRHHHAVGDGRSGEGRPAQDGLPRPAHATLLDNARRSCIEEDARRSKIDLARSCRSTTPRPTRSCSAATPRACSSSSPTASASCSSG